MFHFHHLAVEDALQETHVPKVDDWGNYLYIVFHVPHIDPGSDKLELQELDIFLGPNYLVTYHVAPMAILRVDREIIARDPRDRLRQGADHLLFRFLELAVDQSLAAIEKLDEQVDALQNSSSNTRRPRSSARSSGSSGRPSSSTRRSSPARGPQPPGPRPYEPVQPEHRVYFRDLYDHVVRIHDISESLRDLIAGTLETYLSVVSNRTNDIMKTLTIVTVMFLPMSFLAGFFGMNFFGEPLVLQVAHAQGLALLATCVIMAISPCFIWIYANVGNGSDGRATGGQPRQWTSPTMNARWRLRPHDERRSAS